jgi:hypothetical protein
LSDAVWSISTIKVDSNMGDAYLEGIKRTWVASNELSKKLGQIEITRSHQRSPDTGEFNMMLIAKFKNTADRPQQGPLTPRSEWVRPATRETTSSPEELPGNAQVHGPVLMRGHLK